MYTAIDGIGPRDIGAAHLFLHIRDGDKPDFDCAYCKRPQHEEKLARSYHNTISGFRPKSKKRIPA